MKIIAICGKSSVGKSTYINKLMEEGKYHYVKSYTTRPIRTNDDNDINTHIFVDKQYYLDNIDKVIALYRSPNGYVSWTDLKCFSSDLPNLYAIDPIAVKEELYPFCKKHNIELEVIYLEVPELIRMERFFKREGSLKNFEEERHLALDNLDGLDIPIKVIQNYDKNYCYSFDGETYYYGGTYQNTLLDLVDDYGYAGVNLSTDEDSQFFHAYIAEVKNYENELSATDVIEQFQQNASYEDPSDYSMDYLEDLTKEQIDWLDFELSKLIKEFELKFDIVPPYFTAKNPKKVRINVKKSTEDAIETFDSVQELCDVNDR